MTSICFCDATGCRGRDPAPVVEFELHFEPGSLEGSVTGLPGTATVRLTY